MKMETEMKYEAPEVLLLEMAVECGYAGSPEPPTGDGVDAGF